MPDSITGKVSRNIGVLHEAVVALQVVLFFQDVRQEINDNDNAEDEGQPLGGKRRRSGKSSDSSSTHCEGTIYYYS